MATSSIAGKHTADGNDEPAGGKSPNPEKSVDLVDDCWLAVFAKLDVFDLLNVANTCVRFRNLVHENLLSHIHLNPTEPGKDPTNNNSKLRQRVVDKHTKAIIKQFGPTAKAISVNMAQYFPSYFEQDETLSEIKKCCPNLEVFRMYNFSLKSWPKYFMDDVEEPYLGSGYDPRGTALWNRNWCRIIEDESITECPPIAKTYIVENSLMYVGLPMFLHWKQNAQSICFKNVTLSGELLRHIKRLWNQVKMDCTETRSSVRSQPYTIVQINEALFLAKEHSW